MTAPLIILALLAIAVGVVVWVVRRQPDKPRVGPQEGDTAWNDPVAPAEPAPPARADTLAETPPTRDPRP